MSYILILIIGFALGMWVQKLFHATQLKSQLQEESNRFGTKKTDNKEYCSKARVGLPSVSSISPKSPEQIDISNQTHNQSITDKNRQRSQYLKQKYSGSNAAGIILKSTDGEHHLDATENKNHTGPLQHANNQTQIDSNHQSITDRNRQRSQYLKQKYSGISAAAIILRNTENGTDSFNIKLAEKPTRKFKNTPQASEGNRAKGTDINLAEQTLEQLQLLKLHHIKGKPRQTHFMNQQNDIVEELEVAKQWRLRLHEIATAIHDKQHSNRELNICNSKNSPPKERTPEELKLLQEQIRRSNPSKRPWSPKKSELVDSTQLEGRNGYYR